MTRYYAICFGISLLLLIYVMGTNERRNIHLSLLLGIIAMANGGYLALALSRGIHVAILANKISYVGGCFTPMLYFMIVCDLCQIRVGYRLVIPMYLLQCAIYTMVCTIGYSTLYYKDVEFHIYRGIGYLVKTYGPLHKLYLITMIGYFIASTIIVLVSMRRKNVVSFKNTAVLLGSLLTVYAAYMTERLLNSPVEIIPLMYVLLIVAALIPVHKMSIFSIERNTEKDTKAGNMVSYIIFNRRLEYMGCNDQAMEIFPEIKEYNLDQKIPKDNSYFSDRVMPIIEDNPEEMVNQLKTISHKDHYYEMRLQEVLGHHNKNLGYLMELTDVTERQRYVNMIEDYNRNLEREVKGKTQRIREIQERTLLGMAQMVESRDLSTGGHIRRTSQVVSLFAVNMKHNNLGLDQEFLQYIVRSAPMHDLGKIAVDDQILRKQGKFTEEEFEIMKKHASAGAQIVRKILTGIEDEGFVEVAANLAHYHHERYDGTGYPEGLKGEEIPIEARIMALADVFDALVSSRCYKDAFDFDEAFRIIEEESGTHFDPVITETFLNMKEDLKTLYITDRAQFSDE